MIFKVSDKFKGSCVLPTINKAIWANMVLSISGNDLRADDIKDVVRRGILIPEDKDYDKDEIEKDHDVIIINNTKRVLILGKIALRPNGSLPISKDDAKSASIISAAEEGCITILSDEGEETYVRKKSAKKKDKKSKIKKGNKKEVDDDFITPETGEDKDPVAQVWNFQTKESEEAVKISKTQETKIIDDNPEANDVDFVDKKEEEPKKKSTKKKTKKKATKKAKKKATKKSTKKKSKKEETKPKSKNVKTLEPIGERKVPKTEMDAAIELDSRGNPIGDKPGETLRHLIDSVNNGEEVSFVDEEQKIERYNKRADLD